MKINYNGKETEGKSIEFLIRKEDFNEYQLVNGPVLRMKTVLTRVVEVVGEKGPEGNPIYQVNSQTVIAPVDF